MEGDATALVSEEPFIGEVGRIRPAFHLSILLVSVLYKQTFPLSVSCHRPSRGRSQGSVCSETGEAVLILVLYYEDPLSYFFSKFNNGQMQYFSNYLTMSSSYFSDAF